MKVTDKMADVLDEKMRDIVQDYWNSMECPDDEMRDEMRLDF